MTTASPTSAGSMRQQLDELDALLQRMLSLPEAGESNGSPAGHAEPEMDLGDAWKSPPMTLLRDSGPVAAPPEPPRWDPSWSINLNPQNGSSILGSRSPAANAATPPLPAAPTEVSAPQPMPAVLPPPVVADPPPTIAFPQPTLSDPPPRGDPPPLWAWPFIAIDRLFDALVGLLPFGSLLTTRIGKNIVGVAGILLLAGGIAWGAIEYLGWIR